MLPGISDVDRRHKAESACRSSIIHQQKDKHMLPFPLPPPPPPCYGFLKTPHLGLVCIFFSSFGPRPTRLGTAAFRKTKFSGSSLTVGLILWRSPTLRCVTRQLLVVKYLLEANLAFIHFIQCLTVRNSCAVPTELEEHSTELGFEFKPKKGGC